MSVGDTRPQSFEDFIGQDQPRKILEILARSAKKQQAAVAHVLISGPPGLGKTTLSRILAHEMGSNLVEVVGLNVQEPRQIQSILAALNPFDVLMIDELHGLNRQTAECLHGPMEDGVLSYVPEGEFNGVMKALGMGGTVRRPTTVRLPPFTLVGATTLPGLVSAPLRSRFVQMLCLEPYTGEELQVIVSRTARKMGFPVSDTVAREVARRSRNTEYCLAQGERASVEAACRAFAMKELDGNGLNRQDRQLLSFLVNSDGPVGISSLAAILGESERTLTESIEPFLMREGYLRRSPRGRVAGQKAYELMRGAAA